MMMMVVIKIMMIVVRMADDGRSGTGYCVMA